MNAFACCECSSRMHEMGLQSWRPNEYSMLNPLFVSRLGAEGVN